MTPSLRPGDQVLVDTSAYGDDEPARGDVVVFSNPHAEWRHDVKRVIGLPGERVVMEEGVLFIDGCHIDEPYLGEMPSSVGLGEWARDLGADEYLVLGDNRAHSTDSRDFGPVRATSIVGRAWAALLAAHGLGHAGPAESLGSGHDVAELLDVLLPPPVEDGYVGTEGEVADALVEERLGVLGVAESRPWAGCPSRGPSCGRSRGLR